MYTEASSTFKECMKSNRGILTSRLTIDMNGTDLVIGADGIVSVEESSASTTDEIRFGGLVLPTMSFKLLKDKYNVMNLDLRGKEVLWEVGLKPDESSAFEYVPVRRLTISKTPPVKNGETLSYTAESKLLGKLDQLYVRPQTDNNWTRNVILADITQKTGYTIDVGQSGNFGFPDQNQPTGYTYREVLSAIAEYDGMFITVNRNDDTLMFKWYADSSVIIADSIPESCLGDMQLTDSDENYNGISCPTPSEVLIAGSSPYLVLENSIGQFDGRQSRIDDLLPRLKALVCRTGRIEMQLGNILYDCFDTIHSVPDRHNIIDCHAVSQTVNGITITRNYDGTYYLNGTASYPTWISFESNNIAEGEYRIKRSIVDPASEPYDDRVEWGYHWVFTSGGEIVGNGYYGINIDNEIFQMPGSPVGIEDSYHTMAIHIRQNTELNNILIRPMITDVDDNYDQWEQYKPDLTLPLCQISHSYDGGLKTTINIPEIVKSEDGAEIYTGSESRAERETTEVTKLYQQVNENTTQISELATEVQGKASESDYLALEQRVEYLEQHSGGGGSVSRTIVGTNLRSSVQGITSEVSQ